MELSNFSTKKKSNEGVFLHLKNPETWEEIYELKEKNEDDKTKPVGLRMLGVDSDIAVAAKHARINAQVAKKASKVKPIDALQDFSQKSDAEQNEILADCTCGWENLSLNGDKEFSRENMVKVYSDSGWAWLREQAMAFVNNRANFI